MTKSNLCGLISFKIVLCAQWDSLCNPLLLLYKMFLFFLKFY